MFARQTNPPFERPRAGGLGQIIRSLAKPQSAHKQLSLQYWRRGVRIYCNPLYGCQSEDRIKTTAPLFSERGCDYFLLPGFVELTVDHIAVLRRGVSRPGRGRCALPCRLRALQRAG